MCPQFTSVIFPTLGKYAYQQNHKKVCGIHISPIHRRWITVTQTLSNSKVKKYEHKSHFYHFSSSQPWLNIRITWKHFLKYQCLGTTFRESNLIGLEHWCLFCFKSYLHYSNEQSELRTTTFYISSFSLLPIFHKELFLYQLRLADTFGKAKTNQSANACPPSIIYTVLTYIDFWCPT